MRVVFPASILLSGILSLIYGTVHLSNHADGTSWTITLLGGGCTVGATVLLIFMNTRRARERWIPYVIPQDDEGSKTDSEQ